MACFALKILFKNGRFLKKSPIDAPVIKAVENGLKMAAVKKLANIATKINSFKE